MYLHQDHLVIANGQRAKLTQYATLFTMVTVEKKLIHGGRMKMVSVEHVHGRAISVIIFYIYKLEHGRRRWNEWKSNATHGNIRNEQRLILHHPFHFNQHISPLLQAIYSLVMLTKRFSL